MNLLDVQKSKEAAAILLATAHTVRLLTLLTFYNRIDRRTANRRTAFVRER